MSPWATATVGPAHPRKGVFEVRADVRQPAGRLGAVVRERERDL
jgi:hypothetical protein